MPVITVFSGDISKKLEVSFHKNILDALRENGFFISAPCAGMGTCGKCRITARSFLPTALDLKYLTLDEMERGIRLACDKLVDRDIEICIEEYKISQIETGYAEGIYRRPLDKEKKYAVAFDIGTTTVACYLLELNQDAKAADVIAGGNTQASFGADVITRIQYTMEEPQGLEQLHQCIANQADEMCSAVLGRSMIPAEAVSLLYFAGNTVMLHLLMGINPAGMGTAPYQAEFLQSQSVCAGDIGMKSISAVQCITAPCISAFVGGDITCAALACGAQDWEQPSILIDIGTNGEMLAGNKKGYYCCSAAAGPAFEGGDMRCGMPSIPGAICSVSVKDGVLEVQTIGGEEPLGICGSGIIDVIYCMLELEVIDETGYLDTAHSMVQQQNGIEGFFLCGNIVITQRDIREFQLAKSAVRSAIELLLEEAGWNAKEIDGVYLAGGFGSRLNLEKSIALGLLPEAFLNKTKTVGNASGQGAVLAAADKANRDILDKLAQVTQNIELSEQAGFQDKFMEYMTFERC